MARSKFSIPLHYQIIIMLFAGGFFGYYFNEAVIYTNWMGDLFLRALSMIIVPLILLSITTGVASVGSSGNLGRIGLKTIGFYIINIEWKINFILKPLAPSFRAVRKNNMHSSPRTLVQEFFN